MANAVKSAKKPMATVISESGLNVRAAPNRDADIVKVLRNKEKVELDENAIVPDDWKALAGGGYVVSEYLK